MRLEHLKNNTIPCYHCGKNRAIFRARLEIDGVVILQCLCGVCANLPEIILAEKILRKDEHCQLIESNINLKQAQATVQANPSSILIKVEVENGKQK